MKTLMAGPDGTRYPDKVYPVSAKEGADLIAGGFAEEVKSDAKATAPRAATRPSGRTATKMEANLDAKPTGAGDDADDEDQESQA